jgi:hypothetical protein
MKRRLDRWREAVVAAVTLAAAAAGWAPAVSAQVAHGPEAFNIVGLRMSRVTLYKDCSMDKGVAFSREDLEKRKPWRATTDAKTAA